MVHRCRYGERALVIRFALILLLLIVTTAPSEYDRRTKHADESYLQDETDIIVEVCYTKEGLWRVSNRYQTLRHINFYEVGGRKRALALFVEFGGALWIETGYGLYCSSDKIFMPPAQTKRILNQFWGDSPQALGWDTTDWPSFTKALRQHLKPRMDIPNE